MSLWLIDDHIRSLDIAELMNPREVTYDNFLRYAGKFKSERARTVLVKNKARQIIKELAPTNPVYYEKLMERLEKIIEDEESRRIQDASYFNKIKGIYNDALNAEKERQKLGFSTQFEFAIFGLLQSLKNNEKPSKDTTNAIYTKMKEEVGIVGWKNKRSSEKKMSIAIYDILSENKYPENKTNKLTLKIKTSELIVDAETITVRAPLDKDKLEIQRIVLDKARWILNKQKEYRETMPEENKETFAPLLGFGPQIYAQLSR
jgi:type I restriction enzyme, R subunit